MRRHSISNFEVGGLLVLLLLSIVVGVFSLRQNLSNNSSAQINTNSSPSTSNEPLIKIDVKDPPPLNLDTLPPEQKAKYVTVTYPKGDRPTVDHLWVNVINTSISPFVTVTYITFSQNNQRDNVYSDLQPPNGSLGNWPLIPAFECNSGSVGTVVIHYRFANGFSTAISNTVQCSSINSYNLIENRFDHVTITNTISPYVVLNRITFAETNIPFYDENNINHFMYPSLPPETRILNCDRTGVGPPINTFRVYIHTSDNAPHDYSRNNILCGQDIDVTFYPSQFPSITPVPSPAYINFSAQNIDISPYLIWDTLSYNTVTLNVGLQVNQGNTSPTLNIGCQPGTSYTTQITYHVPPEPISQRHSSPITGLGCPANAPFYLFNPTPTPQHQLQCPSSPSDCTHMFPCDGSHNGNCGRLAGGYCTHDNACPESGNNVCCGLGLQPHSGGSSNTSQ